MAHLATHRSLTKRPVTTSYFKATVQTWHCNRCFYGVLGGDLKRRERLSARLGDILSGLYMGSTTLKRFDEEGRLKEDLPLLHWAMQTTLHDIETAIDDFLANFPNRAIAAALRVMVIPFGRRIGKPSDKTEHAIAQMLKPSTARSRLGYGRYLTVKRKRLAIMNKLLMNMPVRTVFERHESTKS